MSETITAVNTAVDSYQTFILKCNAAINAISTVVVSVNTHANGGLTTGNGFVEGTFGARNLVGNTMAAGTVETSGMLTITNHVASTGDTITIGNVAVNTTDITINGVSVSEVAGLIKFTGTTAGTSDQQVYTFSKIAYAGAEFTVTIKDDNANAYQINKMLIVHDTGDAFTTEYGVVYSNTYLGELSANIDATNVRIYFTPTIANSTISGSTILVPAA
jgi:hypothetical protein